MALHASFSSYSSYSSSSFKYGGTFDVFLSFRGTDTRYGFTGNLYKALRTWGIRTFFDDRELQSGEEIKPSLFKAIQESRIAIIVFSKNYACSSFCLDELAMIMECIKGNGLLVLPIFYDVDPSDLRHHRGTYGEALAKHEERFKDDKRKVQKWRKALHQAANLSGKRFKYGNEYEHTFIDEIVREISKKINFAPLYVADYPVGLESRVLEVKKLLNDGSDDGVHVVGIYGIGGIGKTTLARAVYNSIFDQFEGLCFLENVRQNRLEYLQEMLLSEIVGEKDIKIGSISKGIQIIRRTLCQKKILLILDDVDKQEHLQALAGKPDWFGSGSRVVITTRDKHLLARQGVERTYELHGLDEEDARELFMCNAFKNKVVDPSFMHIINRAVTYATHVPLALEVIGSNLCGKAIEEWKPTLDQYKRIPEKYIQERLKISYDDLEAEVQSVFLDIACCFKGFNLIEVKDILCAHYDIRFADYDVYLKPAIRVLFDKSLIKINQNGEVTLHDLIQDMGREIVRQEGKPSKRSRLWFPEDIIQVLKDNEGECESEIIFLDHLELVEWDGEAFKNMKSLKTLIIRNASFSQGPKHLPNSLRVLEWWGYPSLSLPYDFHLKKLVMVKLPYNCLTSVNFLKMQQELVNLRFLNFNDAEFITDIPNLSCVPQLEKLSFRFCRNLIKIDESVGFLGKLKILDAFGCSKLKSVPPLMLASLEKLDFSYCSSLENFPELLGKMENIISLFSERTSIKEVPFSIRNFTRLRYLQISECGLVEFPISIFLLPELEQVYIGGSCHQNEGGAKVISTLSGYKKLTVSNCNLSDEISAKVFAWVDINVVELKLFDLNCTVLPAYITACLHLRRLTLTRCNIREIRVIPPNLEFLRAEYCRSLQCLDLTILPAGTEEYCFLTSLVLERCESLREIRGIPTNLEVLFVSRCTSLSDSCRSMLLNQELHEKGGNMRLCIPGSRIPEWFEHRNSGLTISFWFRNMLPAISLCLVPEAFKSSPKLSINGNRNAVNDDKWLGWHGMLTISDMIEVDHIFILDEKRMKFDDNVKDVLLENNEWNHVEIIFNPELRPRPGIGMQFGIHVFKEKSNMEDIRFTDPYEKDNNNDVNSGSEFEFNGIEQTSSTSNVKGLQEQQHLTSFDQHKLGDCENVNKAKGKGMLTQAFNSAGEDNGKNPLTKLPSATKELHKEGGNMWLYMRGSRIPEWFDHRTSEVTICFWFRNMLPAISLYLVSSFVDNLGSRYWPAVRINGIEASYEQFTTQDIGYYSRMTEDHMSILDANWMKVEDNVKEVLLENNEWNHTEITFYPVPSQIGIHVFKGKSSMEDIRFTDPYETDNDDDDVNSDSEFEFIGKKRASSTGNVKGLQEQQQLTSFDQHKLEDCENVNKAKGKGMATLACSSTAGEGNGKNPLTELLSATKESTKNYQSASNGKTVAGDQLESEYQVTNPEEQLVSNHESTMSASGCHVMMGLNQRTAKWQFCMCGLFSSLVSLCSSSSSLDSP